MRRLTRSRATQLERRMNMNDPPIGRLFVLIPDLWPEADQEAFHNSNPGEALDDLVERRTGVRPVHDKTRIWAIVHHMPEDARNWDEATKTAFLEEHETRPLSLWQRREWSCG